MSAFKVVDRWWSRRAPLLIGGALIVLTTMTVMLYIGQLQSSSMNASQADQINSLAKALDDQREAAAEGGAEVVVPPASKIKEDPAIIEGVKGDKGEPGEPGATGPSGSPGRSGSDGKAGPSGPPGEPGADGADGADGSDGSDGAPGEPGSDGQDGIGQVGPTGPAGPQGPPGRDGVDGKDGQDGEDGKSPASIRIPVGPVTYICTPSEPGSTDYTCTPEVGDGGTEASGEPTQAVRHEAPIPIQPAAFLPLVLVARKALVRSR